jgi:hypothetical protein
LEKDNKNLGYIFTIRVWRKIIIYW